MAKNNILLWISSILLLVGGLNWGLIGIFNFDLVAALLGDGTFLDRTVKTLVGLSIIPVSGMLIKLK